MRRAQIGFDHAHRDAHRRWRLPRTQRGDPRGRPQGDRRLRRSADRLPRRLARRARGRRSIELTIESTRGILPRGGTILGSSRTNPYKREDGVELVRETLATSTLDGLIAIGGEDTLGVANRLNDDGVNVIGVPKTIDNDLGAHRCDVRLRHRAARRHRGDRPPAHDRREPQPDPGRRGDGPQRGLDRAALGHRRAAPT